MNQIDLGKAIVEALTQPALVKIFLCGIAFIVAVTFLKALLNRIATRIEKKYKDRRLSDFQLFILFLLFISVAVGIWMLF